MKQVYEAGIRTVCFISPVFPGITDIEAIFERTKDQCDLIWLENLNLRGGFKKTIMDYITEYYPDLVPLYEEIYKKRDRSYFEALESKAMVNLVCASPCWLIYDSIVSSWGGVLNESITLASIIVSIVRFGWKSLEQDPEFQM